MVVVSRLAEAENLECGDKSRAVRGVAAPLSPGATRGNTGPTRAQKAASCGIPLAAALQILLSHLRSRRHPV